MKVTILGGTGLVGRAVIHKLLSDPRCSQLISLSRTSTGIVHEKLKEVLAPTETLCEKAASIKADSAICTLGTTMKRAGSRSAFTAIDHDLPLNWAKALKSQGIQNMHLLSSLGSDPNSKNFYLRSKGQLEVDFRNLNFETFNIYKPSLLLGERTESRPLESLAIRLFKGVAPIYPRFLQSWQPIAVSDLAAVLVEQTLKVSPGTRIYENRELHERAPSRNSNK